MQENREPIFCGAAKPRHKKFGFVLNRRTLTDFQFIHFRLGCVCILQLALRDMQKNKEPIFCDAASPRHKKFGFVLNRRTLTTDISMIL
jgi:hypothetical protein